MCNSWRTIGRHAPKTKRFPAALPGARASCPLGARGGGDGCGKSTVLDSRPSSRSPRGERARRPRSGRARGAAFTPLHRPNVARHSHRPVRSSLKRPEGRAPPPHVVGDDGAKFDFTARRWDKRPVKTATPATQKKPPAPLAGTTNPPAQSLPKPRPADYPAQTLGSKLAAEARKLANPLTDEQHAECLAEARALIYGRARTKQATGARR